MQRARSVGWLVVGVAAWAATFGRGDAPPAPRRLCTEPAQAVAVAPDGRTVALGCGRDVRLVALDGTPIRRLIGHGFPVAHLAFAPDGDMLASAAEPGDARPLRFWDAATGAAVRAWGDGSRCVRGLAFTPDGQQLVVLEPDAVSLHNPRLGRFVGELPTPAGWADLTQLALSRDGRTLAVGCSTARRATFEMRSRKLVSRSTAPGPCLGLHFLADNRRLLWLDSYDVYLCDGDGPAPPFAAQSLCGTSAAALSPDGATLAVARAAEVSLWQVAGRRPVASLTGHRGELRALAFAGAKTVVAVGADGAFAWSLP